jgi:glucan phosphoethanolaminetransferase (alkaline phosphatase superfamily)
MQQFYSFITLRFMSLNMFRVPPRPSSGAYNYTNSLWFYRWSVVVAALLVVVWPAGRPSRPQLTTLLPPRFKVKPEAVNPVVSSW